MSATAPEIVLLESGDRLTRSEFHRRYLARPDIKKAELVNGVVYVASPVRWSVHGRQHADVITWLNTYRLRAPGVEVGDNVTVLLDAMTEVQPDACLFRLAPGSSRLRVADGYLEGPPDLVVEVAGSSASYDLHDKLAAYERAGVPEYIVWRVLDGALDWLRLHEGRYARIEPDRRGMIESHGFRGLRLHVPSLLAGDLAAVIAALDAPPAAGVPNPGAGAGR